MIKVYGSSDDLIEIEGDISEEFYAASNGISYVGFSDGTLLQMSYGGDGNGFWRISPLRYGSAKYRKTEATDEDSNYSDIVELDGDVRWVVCSDNWGSK